GRFIAAPRSLATQPSRCADVEAHSTQAPHTEALPPLRSVTRPARTERRRDERATRPPLALAPAASCQMAKEQRPHPQGSEHQDEDYSPAYLLTFPRIPGKATQAGFYGGNCAKPA